jgi:hypothetical protein
MIAEQPVEAHMSWEAWVGILLACVTVILTVFAIVLGIAAIWGYSEIKNEAGRRAQDSIDKKLGEYFGNLDIKARLKAEIEARVSREADQVYKDLSVTKADVQEAETVPKGQPDTGAVGETYPTEEKR